MVNTQFTVDEKTYKKYYTQGIFFYYIKIYLIAIVLGWALIKALGSLFKMESLTASANLMMVSFPIMLFFALICSWVIASYEARRNIKKQRELTIGNFKIKFEKNFFIVQKEGVNTKLHYTDFRFYPALNRGFIVYKPMGKSILVPGNLVTKEQFKTVKQYVKDANAAAK